MLADVDRREDRTIKFIPVVGSVPAVAAAVLGTLYAVGALHKAAELHAAGLSVADVLPLIPTTQLLTRGIAVVYSNAVSIAITAYWLVAAAYLGYSWEQLKAAFGQSVPTGETDLSESVEKNVKAARQLVEGIEEKREEGIRKGEVSAEQLEQLRRDYARAAEVLSDAESLLGRVAKLEEDLETVTADSVPEVKTRAKLGFAWMVLSVLAVLVISTPEYAIGVGVPMLVYVSFPAVRRHVRIYPTYVLGSAAFLIAALVTGAAIVGRELPTVFLHSGGAAIRADLILRTDATWYVRRANDKTFVAIETASVRGPVRVSSPSNERRTVADYLIRAF